MKRNLKVREEVVKKEKFVRREFPKLLPKNENQRLFMEDMEYDSLVVGHGSAGTGKTILACYHAAKQLHTGQIKKIILIRAYQPLAGRSIGFLPGNADEKLLPFYRQMIDYFEDCFGKSSTEIHLKTKAIEICSLETIRGRSWSDCIVICDEGQNLCVQEIQALMTRMGERCQMIVCGDSSGIQTDIKKGMDGLTYLQKIVSKYSIEDSSFIRFTRDDIVRSGITKEFVTAFEEEYELEQLGKGIVNEKEKGKK
jgi:phosphate starvation-inducible PhoH-like protein